MLPVIALVGRPNVGKSTLFNRLTRSRDALVASFPGLTRDRQYGKVRYQDTDYMLVDTGGLSGEQEGIDTLMASQVAAAIHEADVVLFMVDARSGRTGGDEEIAEKLRGLNKTVLLVANKIDGQNPDSLHDEFLGLGFSHPAVISATNGQGISELQGRIFDVIDNMGGRTGSDAVEPEGGIRIAVAGRPNTGKSTLVNRLLGEERVVVFDEAGTTRDSIYIPFERNGKRYTLIDTAGVRRKGRVSEKIEKFSVIKTLEAINDANVVIMMMDAREGVVDQDLHLISHIVEAGRALVLAVNKWDGTSQEEKDKVRKDIDRKLTFIPFSSIHFISALHGSGVGELYNTIHRAYDSATRSIKTALLNEILDKATRNHPPPLVKGHRIRLKYAHSGGSNPPVIVIHGNQTESVPESYQRYLQKQFIEALELEGTPVRLEFRTSDNPFKGRKNPLTLRQIARKRRLMSHVKKGGKKKK